MTTITPVGAALPPLAQATATLNGPSDSNRILGRFRVRYADHLERSSFHGHTELRAGGQVGAREGYRTLREAVRDLAHRTDEDVPAAAVVERNGRYYGYAVKARDLDRGLHSPLGKVHFEPDEASEVLEMRADQRFERLRAVVDGEFVRSFRA